MNLARFLPRRVSQIVVVFADERKAREEAKKKNYHRFVDTLTDECLLDAAKVVNLMDPTIAPPVTAELEVELRSSRGNLRCGGKRSLAISSFARWLATLKEMFKLS